MFVFRSPWIDYDYHDLSAQKRILHDAFADHTEWKVPELLRAAIGDSELYFDSVSQIHMPTWHSGPGGIGRRFGILRVAAVGSRNQSGDDRGLAAGRGTP